MAAVVVLLLLLCAAFVVIPFAGATVLVPFLAAEVLLLCLGISQIFARRLGQPNATAGDLALLDDREDLDLCLVEITIHRDGRAVGKDRGVAWFEGGRMLYSGHRTSFALGGEDLVPRSEREKRPSDGRSVLPIRVPQGTATVELVALAYGTSRQEREFRLGRRLYEFLFFTPASRGPRQWPPFDS